MKKSTKKKAFTLVELLVVIAILAILASVSIVGYLGFTERAKESNDQSLVTQLNVALKGQEALNGKPETMHEVVQTVSENGFVIDKLTPTSDKNNFLWNEDTNEFVVADKSNNITFPKDTTYSDASHLWKVVDTYDASTPFSQYLKDKDFTGPNPTLTVKTGLDLGDNKEPFNITYDSNLPKAKIRTNSSSQKLTVNTTTSVVEHYGPLGEVTINEVPMESYHEFGDVAFATILKGRFVVETNASVKVLYAKASQANNVKIEASSSSKVDTAFGSVANITSNITITVETNEDTVKEKGNAAKTESIEKENYKGDVLVTKANTDSKYLTLAQFRDSVNKGESYKDSTVVMQVNVDLKDVANWEPIGTKEHPFDGKFDGNNKTIKNLTVKSDGYFGLFGSIIGDDINLFNPIQANWDSIYNPETQEFHKDLVAENKYSCVIKNLNITKSNFLTTQEGEFLDDDFARYTGALVGHAKNAYISDINVSETRVFGHKYSGGIVGYLEKSVLNNATTTNDVKLDVTVDFVTEVKDGNRVEAKSGNSGGIVGKGTNSVFMNCENNAVISTNKGYGGYAGIMGFTNDPQIFYNCTNNADIIFGDDIHAAYVAGIAGSASTGALHINSVNNGNIHSINASGDYDTIGGIQGLATNNISKYYNCVNNGNLSGEAKYMGGIVGCGHTSRNLESSFNNCVSTGELVNNRVNGTINFYNGYGEAIKLQNKEYETTAALETDIIKQSGNNFKQIILENVTIKDGGLGTLNVPSNVIKLTADKKICTDVTFEKPTEQSSVKISIPNISFDLNKDLSNLRVEIEGKENIVTLNNGGKVDWLSVTGDSSIVTINGSDRSTLLMDRLIIGGQGTKATINENSYLGGVSFTGTGTVTLDNYGLLSRTDAKGNQHTLSSVGKANGRHIIVNNHGTIEMLKSVGSYALLFYDDVLVDFNAYNGSLIKSTSELGGSYLMVASRGEITKVNLNYETGAIVEIYGKQYTDAWEEKINSTNVYVKKGIK